MTLDLSLEPPAQIPTRHPHLDAYLASQIQHNYTKSWFFFLLTAPLQSLLYYMAPPFTWFPRPQDLGIISDLASSLSSPSVCSTWQLSYQSTSWKFPHLSTLIQMAPISQASMLPLWPHYYQSPTQSGLSKVNMIVSLLLLKTPWWLPSILWIESKLLTMDSQTLLLISSHLLALCFVHSIPANVSFLLFLFLASGPLHLLFSAWSTFPWHPCLAHLHSILVSIWVVFSPTQKALFKWPFTYLKSPVLPDPFLPCFIFLH